ncbi:hypothetical protein TIFTF001_021996 [Ficus carica]|uniref:Uncharacterized protein n=1 Tax=Ficus carica TaxID=3494 RepID=A0AA88AZ90_FICCA|nr:hypothetical protein TIFTF001_021996 [Ficus carica]
MVEFVASKLAEAVVSQAVQRIADLLFHEAASLSSVRGDVEKLQKELTWMQCFLRDADRKQDQDDRVRKWVAEVRDVAHDVEDAIETYVYKVHSSHNIVKGLHIRKLRTKIDSIKDDLKSICERRLRYQIDLSRGEGGSSFMNLRRSYPDDEDDEVVSLTESVVALKAQLMREEDRLCVISIVGMGGIGKTTLAKKVFNDVDVKKHFDCCAWVFISQQYAIRDVLCEIIVQVGFPSRWKEKMDIRERLQQWEKVDKKDILEQLIKGERERLKDAREHELVDRLKKELKEERYLVVFDDVWSARAWESMKSAFPKGKKGSKVVFTTRKKDVALDVDPFSPPIEPPLLTEQESWELLHQKAFPKSIFPQHNCPKEFEELGKEMVKKCGGLPLAIVMLGGLLRVKKSPEEWKKVHRNINSHLNNSKSEYGVVEILALSYHDLPYNLKPCFLYLGSFPEYWEIPKGKLIRLWIAEGFIPTQKNEIEETIEDVAEQYLEELINRCMVQVDKRDHTGMGVKTCRIHDRMRDFCVSKAIEDNFFAIAEQLEGNTTTPSNRHFATVHSRRVAVHLGSSFGTHHVHSQIRSLLWSDVDNDLGNLQLTNKKFRLLRVLELGSVRNTRTLHKVPKEIGNLVHLRYLSLRNAEISELPSSLGKLRNLHTLDVRMKVLMKLPETTSRLIRLRHLFLPDSRHKGDITWSRCHFRMDNLTNLQTLKHVRAEDLIAHDAVFKMTNLQHLVVQFKCSTELISVAESPAFQLGRLRSLEMYMQNPTETNRASRPIHEDEHAFTSLESLSRCHLLSKLCLAGKIITRHSSDHLLQSQPESLTKLTLRYTEIKQDGIHVLERLLRNLRFLLLGYESYKDSSMVFSANGFPKLETLQLFGLFQLEEWMVENGAAPSLKRLDIEYLPKLTMIPNGLIHVITLQELNVIRMNRFRARLQLVDGIKGEDFHKVQHIPSVSFLNTTV